MALKKQSIERLIVNSNAIRVIADERLDGTCDVIVAKGHGFRNLSFYHANGKTKDDAIKNAIKEVKNGN